MEHIVVNKLMKLIYPLSMELKLELLSKLSDSLKSEFHTKQKSKAVLLEELCGAWSDTDENLAEEILKSRSIC